MKVVLEIKSGTLCQVTSDSVVEIVVIDHDVGETEMWQGVQVNPRYIRQVFQKIKTDERR